MKKLNWSIISVGLIIGLIVFVIWYYKIYEPSQQNKALGKAKKKDGNPRQTAIDFNEKQTGVKSKFRAVNDVILLRERQSQALLLAKQRPEDKEVYEDLAQQYHKEAQRLEAYLNNNYKALKGNDLDYFDLNNAEMYFNESTQNFADNDNVTISELESVIDSRYVKVNNRFGSYINVVGYSFFKRFLMFDLEPNKYNGKFEVVTLTILEEKSIKNFWCNGEQENKRI